MRVRDSGRTRERDGTTETLRVHTANRTAQAVSGSGARETMGDDVERATRRTRVGRCATGQHQGRCGRCGRCGRWRRCGRWGALQSSLPFDEPSHLIFDDITHAYGVPAHSHVPTQVSVVRITPPRLDVMRGVSVQPVGVPFGASSSRASLSPRQNTEGHSQCLQRRKRAQL